MIVMNLSAVEKHKGSGARLLGLNLASTTYYLYEFETDYLTSLSLCEAWLTVYTKAVVSLSDHVYKVLSPEPDNIVGPC